VGVRVVQDQLDCTAVAAFQLLYQFNYQDEVVGLAAKNVESGGLSGSWRTLWPGARARLVRVSAQVVWAEIVIASLWLALTAKAIINIRFQYRQLIVLSPTANIWSSNAEYPI